MPVKIRVKENGQEASMQLISPTLFPSLDRLQSIKVDTPRYWPTFIDVANNKAHKQWLTRDQSVYVKRRTMFLSYLEDPKGSRSLFVRSGMSTGEAATLDNPQLADMKNLPAGDLKQFITSFSNDYLFTAFADRFCGDIGETEEEKTLSAFCYAALLDCIIQDKPHMLPVYLQVYRTRVMNPRSRYYQLVQHDMRLTASFYYKIYERRFSGRAEGILRPPLIRENSILSALRFVDDKHKPSQSDPEFQRAFRAYALADTEAVNASNAGAMAELSVEREIAWYLLRHSVPCASHLAALRELARETFENLAMKPPPGGIYGTDKGSTLEEAVKLVLHGTGSTLVKPTGHWTLQSLEDIMRVWQS
jgi:anaphase-promoting complex subunit 1